MKSLKSDKIESFLISNGRRILNATRLLFQSADPNQPVLFVIIMADCLLLAALAKIIALGVAAIRWMKAKKR